MHDNDFIFCPYDVWLSLNRSIRFLISWGIDIKIVLVFIFFDANLIFIRLIANVPRTAKVAAYNLRSCQRWLLSEVESERGHEAFKRWQFAEAKGDFAPKHPNHSMQLLTIYHSAMFFAAILILKVLFLNSWHSFFSAQGCPALINYFYQIMFPLVHLFLSILEKITASRTQG